jgi:mannose-6-phosphate isomerase-like protein (cupin superfamily)
MKYQIKSISQIPFEGTHSLPNSRQTLATKEDIVSDNIDALTKGILPSGSVWDWHKHETYDELCIVLKGNGKFYWENEVTEYHAEDVIIIPANSNHKIEATGNETNEFYFVRIKT